MSNANTMPFYRVINTLRNSEQTAFGYSNNEKRVKDLSVKRTDILEYIGGKTSPFWIFMSFAGIMSAIGFGIYAAFNAQGAIAGIVDPMANGVIPVWTFLVIGTAISIVGMLFGHFIYEGFSNGFKTDPITGQRLLINKIWLGIVGLVGAIFYIGYQFVLVKSAGDGNGALAKMPYVVAGIAVIELLIGALILHKAFAYLLLFVNSIMAVIATRQMNTNARLTNNHYRDYLAFLNVYNNEHPANRMEVEGNDNIRRAIAYFTGTRLPQENINNDDSGTVETERTDSPVTSISRNDGTAANNGTARENLESFLNDNNIDEDLTA